MLAGWPSTATGLSGRLRQCPARLSDLTVHRWRETDAAFAVDLADAAMALFYDVENGGFYFTAADQPSLIFNPKPSFDEALPPGNATLTNALLHLGQVLGNTTYLDAATNTLRWARAAMERYPANHCSLSAPCNPVSRRTKPLSYADRIQTCGIGGKRFAKVISHGSPSTACPTISQDRYNYLPGLVSAATRSQVSAFVFEDGHASAAINDLEELRRVLGGS